MMNRRGATAGDIIFIVAVTFVTALILFIMYFASDTIFSGLKANPEVNSSEAAVDALDAFTVQISKFDYIGFLVFIAMALAIIISGYFVAGNIIFMFLYFIVVIIAVVLSTILANFWEEVTVMAVFGTTTTAFPIMNLIFSHFAFYSSIIGGLGILVMFAKSFGGE